MKKYLPLLVFFMMANFIIAQNIEVEPLLVTEWEEGYLGADDRVGHARMTNPSNEEKTFTWTREIICNSAGFSVQYCDTAGCYFPQITEGSIILIAGGTSNMDVHANTNGVSGVELEIKITLTEVGNEANTVTGTFQYEECGIGTSTNDELELAKAITLFPNPVGEEFYLTENTVVENIVVYNILGSVVERFNVNNSNAYDVAGLNAGMYLVQLLGEDDDVLRTMKMNKQ